MTNNTDGAALLPVTQADRAFAAKWTSIRGEFDELAQDAARHRISHSLPGDVGTILREMRDTNFSVSGKDAEQVEAWFREQANKALAALTPSALSGDAGEGE